jgi:serine/threonine protein kinase
VLDRKCEKLPIELFCRDLCKKMHTDFLRFIKNPDATLSPLLYLQALGISDVDEMILKIKKILIICYRHLPPNSPNRILIQEHFNIFSFLHKYHAKLQRVKAVAKGYSVRRKVVLPHQIIPICTDLSKNYPNCAGKIQCLCRDILKVVEEPNVPLIFMQNGPREYLFTNFKPHRNEIDPPVQISMDLAYWIKATSKDYRIQILLPFTGLKGGYKKVFEAKLFIIPYKPCSQGKTLSYIPTILSRSIDNPKPPNPIKQIAAVKEGLEKQKKIKDLLGSSISISDLPFETFSRQEKDDSILELACTWYNSSLDKALTKGIPLNIDKTSYISLSFVQKIKIALDISLVLEQMHEKGYVHRDLKMSNILLSLNAQKNLTAILNDWDLTSAFGRDGCIDATYPYWPTCARLGWALPVCDCYGLAIMLGEILFGNPFYSLAANPMQLLDNSLGSPFTKIVEKTIFEHAKKEIPEFSNKLDEINLSQRKICDLFDFLSTAPNSSHPKTKNLIIEIKTFLMSQGFIQFCIRKDQELFEAIQMDPQFSLQLKNLSSTINTPAGKETLAKLYSYIPSMQTKRVELEQIFTILSFK